MGGCVVFGLSLHICDMCCGCFLFRCTSLYQLYLCIHYEIMYVLLI